MKKTLIVLLALVMVAGAYADTVVSVSDQNTDPLVAADGWIDANGGANSGQALFAGSAATIGTDDRSGIAFLKLPTLPAGHTISSADFQIYLYKSNMVDGDWATDLYALYTTDTPVLSAADHYLGADDPSATKVMDDFNVFDNFNPPYNPADGNYNTDAAADAVLATWLQSQYTGSTPNAAYAVFRLNADALPSGSFQLNRYVASDGLGDTSGSPLPTLTIETIPEPATLGLLGLAGLGAMIARRLRIG